MKISNAKLHWHADELPHSGEFDDVYFSRDDAVGESQHVFIAANNLATRWQALAADQDFVVAELGFGSGLNFMQTVSLWRAAVTTSARLQYLGFEKYPLSHADITRLHHLWPDLREISTQLLAQYPDHTAGCHRLLFGEDIILDLYYGDALAQLQSLSLQRAGKVDCWYLDGFSPARNPALWSPALLKQIAKHSDSGTTLSSYSVAGSVRQSVSEAGFKLEKIPGFGRKRHMLLGRYESPVSDQTGSASKFAATPVSATRPARHALVIGAGLAGCSTASSLARRGWRVTVLDRSAAPAAGASGNPQMALRCRLFKTASPLAEFYLQAFLFASRQFVKLQSEVDIGWHGCGVIQLAGSLNKSSPISASDLAELYAHQVLHAVDSEQASASAGVTLTEAGLLLPLGGWLDPARLCAYYLGHPAIEFRGGSAVQGLHHQGDGWLLTTAGSTPAALTADIVVIANSFEATHFSQSSYLPLQIVRGQISRLAATRASAELRTVVCGERTVYPVQNNCHSIAASFAVDDPSIIPRPVDDSENLRLAQANFATAEILGNELDAGRASIRCNSGDRAPIIGALADPEQTSRSYRELTRNARKSISLSPQQLEQLYYPGLYINVAHGSNGLASCPLSAELVASLACKQYPPCNKAVLQELDAVRFLLRNLKKQVKA